MAAPKDDGIGGLIVRLVEDGKAYVGAEIGLYRALMAERARDAGFAAGFALAAVLIAQAAMFALLVGLMLVLAPMIGRGWATVVVVFAALALAGLLGWLAYLRLAEAIRARKEP